MNPWDAAPVMTGEIAQDTQWRGITPHGHDYRMWVRPGTSDWNTVNACSGLHDEYRIPAGMSGWALDIGAHIGACTIPLLLDNPDLRVQAVEAVEENARVLTQNARLNGVDDRLEIYVAIAAERAFMRGTIALPDDPDHHWIGNQSHVSSTVLHGVTIDLQTLLSRKVVHDQDLGRDVVHLPIARWVWAKADCEGCEYAVFLDPIWNAYLDHIEGEVHGDQQTLVSMLEATHIVQVNAETWHFQAVRRPLAGVH